MIVVTRTLATLASLLAAFAVVKHVGAYAPTSRLFARPLPQSETKATENWMKIKQNAFARQENKGLEPLKMAATEQMFKRKERFHLPSDNVEFDNLPKFRERIAIRAFHFASRKCVQWGAMSTWNPIVKLLSFLLYQADILWAGADKEYYVKRRAMYGPNFISATSIVMSKFDDKASAADSLDAQLLTIPQKRRLFLGSTIMTKDHLPQDKSPTDDKKTRIASPLHVSDPGVEEDPADDDFDHDDLRKALMENVFSTTKISRVEARAKDSVTKKMLTDFADEAKGLDDGESLSPIVERFLLRYFHYVLFDLPADDLPLELLHDTFYKGLNYILYLFGPKWLFSGLLRPIVRPGRLESKLEQVREYYAKSPVLKEYVAVPQGEKALSKEGFVKMLEMIIGVAALQGTKALAITSMTQMPEGYAASAAASGDSSKLRKAVLEVARLDTPVTGAHCITQEDLETKIGSRTLKFPPGTVIFTGMTLANTDEERFDRPYVFDPDRKNMPDRLTSFNSVGERTSASPRICPGRNVAVDCVCQMLTAKAAAEKK